VYDSLDPTNIQDLLFLENRDRKYDEDIYTLRGIYNVQDIDFNLSQFGMFLDNDTLFLTVHINSSVKTVGRKIISGDVVELPHLKDSYALDEASVALKRFYVVEDVNRASEGFSPTWYPHLYRLKLKQIVDSQEFKDILDLPADEEDPGGETLRDLLSTYDREQNINDAVIEQAEADAPKSGYDVSHYYQLRLDPNETGATVEVELEFSSPIALETGTTVFQDTTDAKGSVSGVLDDTRLKVSTTVPVKFDLQSAIRTVDGSFVIGEDENLSVPINVKILSTESTASIQGQTAGRVEIQQVNGAYTTAPPAGKGYQGYLLGGEYVPNGGNFGHGIQFPDSPDKYDYFLRTDFRPKRMFQFDGDKWVKVHDVERMTMTNSTDRQTQKTGFINNKNFVYNDLAVQDTVILTKGDTEIHTDISVTDQAEYLVLKYNTLEKSYAVADYPAMITTQDSSLITIELPEIAGVQESIDYTGAWEVKFYRNREAERQSLSQALRPRADN